MRTQARPFDNVRRMPTRPPPRAPRRHGPSWGRAAALATFVLAALAALAALGGRRPAAPPATPAAPRATPAAPRATPAAPRATPAPAPVAAPSAGPRGLTCAVLSLLVPGAGQLHAGRRARGAAMVAVDLALLAAAALLVAQGGAFLLDHAVRTEVLLGALAANAALLAFRAGAVADAWRLGRRPAAGPARGAILAVLLAAVALPQALVAWYDWTAYDTITTVFADTDPARIAPGLPFQADAPGSVVAAPAGLLSAAAVPEKLRVEPDVTTPVDPAWPRGGRLTVLLLGGDAGPGRSGIRTDTMVVATLDARTRRGALLSLPRNLAEVPVPPSAAALVPGGRFPDILNALYPWASAHPEAFPGGRDPGATALKATAANLTGLRIDYYALVDFRGFVDMVDALGGVTIDVPRPVLDRVSPPTDGEDWIRIDLQAGRQHLDAREAFAYVRARSQSSDYDRIRRQRCVLTALAHQADPVRLLARFPRLAAAARDSVRTDIPRRVLPELIRLVAGVAPRDVVSLGFTPPAYTAGWSGAGHPVPDIPAMRAAARRVIAAPSAVRAAERLGGEVCA